MQTPFIFARYIFPGGKSNFENIRYIHYYFQGIFFEKILVYGNKLRKGRKIPNGKLKQNPNS